MEAVPKIIDNPDVNMMLQVYSRIHKESEEN